MVIQKTEEQITDPLTEQYESSISYIYHVKPSIMKQFFRGLVLILAFVFHLQAGHAQSKYAMPIVSKGTTRVTIANNLFIELSGEYPPGFYPNWGGVVKVQDNNTFNSYAKTELITIENFTNGRSQGRKDGQVVLLSEKDGKAILILSSVYADIVTGSGGAVLNQQP